MAKSLSQTELLADLVAEAVKRHRGAVGVLVRDIPEPDAEHLLLGLMACMDDEKMDLRMPSFWRLSLPQRSNLITPSNSQNFLTASGTNSASSLAGLKRMN